MGGGYAYTPRSHHSCTRNTFIASMETVNFGDECIRTISRHVIEQYPYSTDPYISHPRTSMPACNTNTTYLYENLAALMYVVGGQHGILRAVRQKNITMMHPLSTTCHKYVRPCHSVSKVVLYRLPIPLDLWLPFCFLCVVFYSS